MTTLYAKPTKEIFIPPRPKVGRKPRKVAPEPASTSTKVSAGGSPVALGLDDDDYEDADSGKPKDREKQLKNREAQRKFRERERDRVSDLLDRIEKLEQGEGDKAKEFQEHARRHKEQNDVLREENEALKARDAMREKEMADMKEKMRMLQQSLMIAKAGDKRSVEGDVEGDVEPAKGAPARKRPRTSRAPSVASTSTMSEISYAPTIESTNSLRSSLVTSRSRKPTASVTFALPSPVSDNHAISGRAPAAERTIRVDPLSYASKGETGQISRCGLCFEAVPCLCFSLPESSSQPAYEVGKSASILDHPPPYAPAVPLRRLHQAGSRSTSSAADATARWIITPAPTLSRSLPPNVGSAIDEDPADCTGDPANCPACADDPANQAFCAALGDSHGPDENGDELMRPLTPTNPAASSTSTAQARLEEDVVMGLSSRMMIPSSSRMSISALCCGNPQFCGGGCEASNDGRATLVPLPLSSSYEDTVSSNPVEETKTDQGDNSKETLIPCNVAWQQLKSHSQIDKADLSLLAEVVARTEYLPSSSRPSSIHNSTKTSSSSDGSSSSATTHIGAGTSSAMSAASTSNSSVNTVDTSITTPSSSSIASADTSRLLVPHQELLDHGFNQRRRVTHVSKQGVDEALGLLEGLKSLR